MTTSSIKALTKKKDLSYEEALAVIDHYDKKIKEAALLRSPQQDRREELEKLQGLTFLGTGVGGMFLTITALYLGIVDSNDLILVGGVISSSTSIFLISLSSSRNPIARKILSLLARKRYARYRTEVTLDKQFFDLGEEEYVKIITKLLPRAEKALEIVNESLANERMVYNGSIGNEGFSIRGIACQEIH